MSYSVIFFQLITLNSTAIILTLVILDFTNLHILTPERCDEHPPSFLYGSIPRGRGGDFAPCLPRTVCPAHYRETFYVKSSSSLSKKKTISMTFGDLPANFLLNDFIEREFDINA